MPRQGSIQYAETGVIPMNHHNNQYGKLSLTVQQQHSHAGDNQQPSNWNKGSFNKKEILPCTRELSNFLCRPKCPGTASWHFEATSIWLLLYQCGCLFSEEVPRNLAEKAQGCSYFYSSFIIVQRPGWILQVRSSKELGESGRGFFCHISQNCLLDISTWDNLNFNCFSFY